MLNEKTLHYLQQKNFVGELAEAIGVLKVYMGKPEGDCLVLSLLHDGDKVQKIRFLAQGGPSLIACCAYVTEQLNSKNLACLSSIDSEQLVQYFSLAKTEISKAVLVEDALKQLYKAVNQ
ncbi:iron-sulfur cluster assembly scaffold protein [Piscirickettsia litoralis]|uniref:NIF system FeS cluster assembly NifU N-terminal domain-containing protein n=1 Tax=Piscirickettsia litoralis TaxID=1891921 RepID=A0ABX3A4L6_9GAMM|nr:iron-sulfur cluster assembly scaffold protein [Piscirickettsia litoralis]ODN43798.1 hypothetical protein BGC07_13940 [Piscirickettsia litoralis]